MSYTPKFLWGRLNPEWTGPQPAVVVRGKYVVPSADYQSYSPSERADDIVDLALSNPDNPVYLPVEEVDRRIAELEESLAGLKREADGPYRVYEASNTTAERGARFTQTYRELAALGRVKQDGELLRGSLSDGEWEASLRRSQIRNALGVIRQRTYDVASDEDGRAMHEHFVELGKDLESELADIEDEFPGDPHDVLRKRVEADAAAARRAEVQARKDAGLL